MPKIKHTAQEEVKMLAHLPFIDGHCFCLRTTVAKNEFYKCTVDSAKSNVQTRIYECTLDFDNIKLTKK